jgi:hypothetical protein
MTRRGSFLSGGIQNHFWDELPGRVYCMSMYCSSAIVQYCIEVNSRCRK